MNISLFTYTKNGCDTALKVLNCFEDTEKKAYAPERFSGGGFLPLEQVQDFGEVFLRSD